MKGGESDTSARSHGLDALGVGEVARVLPSALSVDGDGHVWLSRSPDAIDTRPRPGRIEIHRKGVDDYRISVPWSVRTRWATTPNAGAAGGIRASAITHYPLPWSRGLWWATERSRVARYAEDWLSQRNRTFSWYVTLASWVAPFVFLAAGMPLPHMVTFWIVWGASNFPPIHSAVEAIWTRNKNRFAEPGKYVRPWEAASLRRDNPQLRGSIPAPDVLPAALRYRPRELRVHQPASEHIKNFLSKWMSEGSTVPQFSMTMVVTLGCFIARAFVGGVVFGPFSILAYSWGVSQISTLHSVYQAIQMKRHGATWREAKLRVTNPTAFPTGRRFGSSVDYAMYRHQLVAGAAVAPPELESGTATQVAGEGIDARPFPDVPVARPAQPGLPATAPHPGAVLGTVQLPLASVAGSAMALLRTSRAHSARRGGVPAAGRGAALVRARAVPRGRVEVVLH